MYYGDHLQVPAAAVPSNSSLTTYVTRDAADCEDSDNVADRPDGVHLYDARQPRHHRHHGGDQDGIQVTQNNGSKYFYSNCKNIMCHL